MVPSDASLLSLTWGVATVRDAVDQAVALLPGSSRAPGVDVGGRLSRAQVALALTANHELISLSKEPKVQAGEAVSLSALPVSSHLPEKIGAFDSEGRKKLFIDAVLPTVMVAMDEVRQERQQLLAIIAELEASSAGLSFAVSQKEWQQRLGADKTKFILGLTRKYRTESAEELVAMVNVLPPSLVLAQGALESAWGASRFAIEVNNLFGMYASEGDFSKAADGGGAPRILEYDTILDSVRAYVLNINRLSAYKELRRIRCQTLDPMLIAEGLTLYSERKEYYIADVKHIIQRNNLRDFDALISGAV